MVGRGIVSVKGRLAVVAGFVLLGVTAPVLAQKPASKQDGYGLIDMRIGTAHDGQTAPFVGPPFSMTNWVAQTQASEKKCTSPYYDKDTQWSGIRGSHWMSGSCTQDYGSVTLMPVTGSVDDLTAETRAATFSHAMRRWIPPITRSSWLATAERRPK